MSTQADSPGAMKIDRNFGLGKLLRQRRNDIKVTQLEVAEALGLERTSVSNIEGGLQPTTIEKLHAYAERVDLEVVITLRPKSRARPAAPVHVVLTAAA